MALYLAALAATAPGPVGVLQVARGATAAGLEARPGQRLPAEARVSVAPGGWAELSLGGGSAGGPPLIARLSAGAEVVVMQDSLRLLEGRAWLTRTGRGPALAWAQLPDVAVALPEGASVVLEHTRSLGTLVVVRAGAVQLRSPGGAEATSVLRGQVVRVAPGGAMGPVQAGGAALGDLVAQEAAAAQPDLAGVQAYLRAEGARARRALGRPELGATVRGPAEVLGADAGAVGALVEDALRPPPFFPEEVPPKGPNLEVEVRFVEP
jgi:hypothetical protein